MAQKIFVVVATLGLTAVTTFAQSKPSLQGVWRAAEVTITLPNQNYGQLPKGTHTDLQPSQLIITGKHYSVLADTSAKPRPVTPFKDPAHPTTEEATGRWGPFIAHGGTYEVSGNVITYHPTVNKSSPNQGRGSFARVNFKLDGNNLWITEAETNNGKVQNPATIKYVRVE